MRFDLRELGSFVRGELSGIPSDSPIFADGISIDSRTIEKGNLFFAIKGERFDGADFIGDAVSKGAPAVVVGKRQAEKLPNEIPALVTKDASLALRDFGGFARKSVKGLKVIGITGSAGKTTSKEMTYALLQGSYVTGKTEGNLNNLYGVPVSLSRMNGDEEIFVAEMGMSTPGELTKLVAMLDPDIGVLLNVYPVHLMNFDSVQAIADAKAELFRSMRKNAIAIFNNDNDFSKSIGKEFKGKKISYGISRKSDLMAEDIHYRGFEKTEFILRVGEVRLELSIPMFGLANVYNFLSAASVAFTLDVPLNNLQRRIDAMLRVSGRGHAFKLRNNITLLDDSYNSNPVAMEMLLDFVHRYRNEGRKVVIAGDMLELGNQELEEHKRMGRVIAKSDIDVLVTIGRLSKTMADGAMESGMKKKNVFHFDTSSDAADRINELVTDDDLVLVKGSRGIKTDKVVEKLKKDLM